MARDFEDRLVDPLVFHLHSSAPQVVRLVLLERGWNEFDDRANDKTKWNLQWRGSAFCASEHDNIKPWQRLNHHPKTVRMMRKDNLARQLKRMQGIYGASQYEFSPTAFILPNDYTKFVAEYTKERQHGAKRSYWICKPADLSRGRGIFIFHDIKDLLYDCAVIVQKYITNPLLISGYKFDLRIYVCVTSFCPLTVYMYQEGLVRFATEKFDLNSLDNIFAHLTNTSINKFGASYGKDKERVGSGCKWTLCQFWSYLRRLEVDDVLLWQKIQNIVTLTLLAIAPSVPHASNCFELFGFDILIDETLKPWLLEVNFSPALSLDCASDATVKISLIHDIINLLNYKASDSSMTGSDGTKTQTSTNYGSNHLQKTLNRSENSQPVGFRAVKKPESILQYRHFYNDNSALRPSNGSCSPKENSQAGHNQQTSHKKLNLPKPLRNETFHSLDCLGDETDTLENMFPDEQSLPPAFDVAHSLPQPPNDSISKELMVNGSITRTHPRTTLTSRMREKMSMPQHSAPSTSATTQATQVLASARTKRFTNGSLPSAHWLRLSQAPKCTFPLYFTSDVDKRPLPRVGDFILVFPFNEATYAASKNKTDVKIIIQEIQRLMKVVVTTARDEEKKR